MYARTTPEPGKVPAGLLAILVHAAFFALLVFGVTWRTQSPAPVMVDVWNSLPSPKVTPAERKQEAPPPSEPKPEPKPQPKPQPKAEPEPAPDPEIALKEKQEKKKKLEEEKRKQELEKIKEEETKKEDERLKQEKIKEAQAKKLAAQKEAQAKAATEQAASNAKINDYIARIAAKIKSNTIIPPEVVGNPQVVYEITLLPTGEILELSLVKSSGFPSYDAAAERAIRKSTPLPIPKEDPALFASQFRTRNYVFRPDD